MRNPKLDILKYQPLPEVGAALRERHKRIIAAWRKKVLEVLPDADELTLAQLHNSVPELIEQIADALEASDPGPTAELMRASPEHGATRFDQNFNLNELLIEYHLLRGTILEQLSKALGRELTTVEAMGVNSGLDVALRQAAVSFAKQQAQEQKAQTEATAKYLAFLSHDIRGNLNAALLMAEVLRRELAKEPQYTELINDLDIMRRSMLETVSTMDRFLAAEQLRRGSMSVKLASVDLNALLKSTAKALAYQSKERGIELIVEASKDCKIVSDRDVLMLILQNLLSNAIKYGGTGAVRLRAAPAADGGARISVIDEGPGIAPEMLASLFAPFARGQTHGQAGTGLGLTIARQAADLLGAALHAESKPGEGTAFHLDLPAA